MIFSQLACFLLGVALGLAGGVCWDNATSTKKGLSGEHLWLLLEMGLGEGCHRCSAAELGITLGKPVLYKRNIVFICVWVYMCLYKHVCIVM